MNEQQRIDLLDEEFQNLMMELNDAETQDEQKVKILDRLETISKIRNERVKTNTEVADFERKHEDESRKAAQKIKDDKRELWAKIGMTTFEVAVPAVIYCVWAYLGFKFEENGTIRSSISKQNNGRIKASR